MHHTPATTTVYQHTVLIYSKARELAQFDSTRNVNLRVRFNLFRSEVKQFGCDTDGIWDFNIYETLKNGIYRCKIKTDEEGQVPYRTRAQSL